MRILILHNRYIWAGGEDLAVDAEAQLLLAHGHEVIKKIADNHAVTQNGKLSTAIALLKASWSQKRYKWALQMIREVKPDIVHLHNFWFALSPSVLAAAHEAGVPTVMTLHNFRLLCAGGVLLDSSGSACMRCVGHSLWYGIIHRCYHNSFVASAMVARMIYHNRSRGTWKKDIDLFIVPSEFCRKVLVKGGMPEESIRVKPNFISDPGRPGDWVTTQNEPQVLFIGRLSAEKGLFTLLEAWRKVNKKVKARLVLAGDGVLRKDLESMAGDMNVEFLGPISSEEVVENIRQSAAVVLPSECYETFGRVIIEAYSCGKPVVVSNLGGPGELVEEGKTGYLFTGGDPSDMAEKLIAMLSDERRRKEMGEYARSVYLEKYVPEENYIQLLQCYESAKRRFA